MWLTKCFQRCLHIHKHCNPLVFNLNNHVVLRFQKHVPLFVMQCMNVLLKHFVSKVDMLTNSTIFIILFNENSEMFSSFKFVSFFIFTFPVNEYLLDGLRQPYTYNILRKIVYASYDNVRPCPRFYWHYRKITGLCTASYG